MLEQFDEFQLLMELRKRGCAVACFFPEEFAGFESERNHLESYMAEMGVEYLDGLLFDASLGADNASA